MKIVIVEWVDTASYSGWHKLNEYDTYSNCISVGLLAQETENQITIALSKSDSGNIGDSISIPQCAIKRMRQLKIKDDNQGGELC